MSRLYNEEGWKDNTANFVTQGAIGITEPNFEDMGNGVYAHGFTNGEALVTSHHMNHDVKPGGDTYFHIHWAPSTAMTAGETITWTINYIVARGYHQGDSVIGVTSTLNLEYTADGTEIAGEHMVLESLTPITTPEPDSHISSKITYSDGTYNTKSYAFAMGIHYQVDRNATPNKEPNFYGA